MFDPSFIMLMSPAFVFYLHIFWYKTHREALLACTLITIIVAVSNDYTTKYITYGIYELFKPNNASDIDLAKHFLGYFNFNLKWRKTIAGGFEELFRSLFLIFWAYIFFRFINTRTTKKYKDSFLENHINGLAFIYGAYESFQIVNTKKMWPVLENTYKSGTADGLYLLHLSEDQRLGILSTFVLALVFITRYYLHLMHLRFSVLSLYNRKYYLYILSILSHVGISAVFTLFSYGRNFNSVPELFLTLLIAQIIAIMLLWFVINTYVKPNRLELVKTTNQ